MNNKEAKDIAMSITVALDSFFDKNSLAETVANDSIMAIRDILLKHEKIRDIVDEIYTAYSDEDDDKKFKEQWDKQISWIEFMKNGW